MSYSDFDLKKVRSAFNLDIIESENLFSNVESVEISIFLSEILKQNVPLALAIGTEKASSELIIIRIFLELRSPEQFFLDVPIIAVVEAKNERITSGNSQSLALHLIYKRFFSKIERFQ